MSAHVRTTVLEAMASTIFALRCISYSAVAFHIYEWLSHLGFETSHVWRKASSSIVKWQFLFTRYLGIAVQVCNAVVVAQLQATDTVPRKLCEIWYGFQLFSGQTMVLLLELSLILRLSALYGCNPRMIVFLLVLVGLEYPNMLFWGIVALRKTELVGACALKKAPVMVAYLVIIQMAVQGVIWTLTLLKYQRRKIPILSLVIRDGSWVFGVMLALFAGITANIVVTHLSSEIHHGLFPVFVAIVSSANCHMITNMEVLPHTESGSSSSAMIELTTVISEPQSEQVSTNAP